MAVQFEHELDKLTADLSHGGFNVLRVYRFPKVPARTVQLSLTNGVHLTWDRQLRRVYVDGPTEQRATVEKFLHLAYESPWFARSWALYPRALRIAAAAAVLVAGGIAFAASNRPAPPSVAKRAPIALAVAD